MLILSATTDKLQMYLGAAHSTGDLRIVCSWRDVTTTTYTPGRTVEISDGTTPVDIVTSPAASTQRVVDLVNIYNADSISHTVTVTFVDNATSYVLWSGLVPAGGMLTYVEGAGWSTTGGALGYTLNVAATNFSPLDGATIYFGNRMSVPTGTDGAQRVYAPRTGTIRAAYLHFQAGTAGTAEAWQADVRINSSSDVLIASVSAATNTRIFSNASMSQLITAGDFLEIKLTNPTWATNPANVTIGGHIYIE